MSRVRVLSAIVLAGVLVVVLSATGSANAVRPPKIASNPCADSCAALRQQALDAASSQLRTCLANAGGDPELEGACQYLFDLASYTADLRYQQCYGTCSPVPTRRVPWGRVKAYYR